jgi:sortase A
MDPSKIPTNRATPTSAPNDTRDATASVVRGQIDHILTADGSANPTLSFQSSDKPHQPMINQTPAPARNDAETAHRHYHKAWQDYYQKYYEDYYLSAVKQQNSAYNERLAQVSEQARRAAAEVAKNVANGTMTQQEAMEEMRQNVLNKVKSRAKKVRKSRHFVPAIAAVVVVLLTAFIQYNGLIFAQVASFISPGNISDQTIIIGTGEGQPISQEPRIIIPKINVSAPVGYGLPDLSESTAQNALKNGPIHYPVKGASAVPGQNGNTLILGHSSGDWFESGDYKFIFVQLNRLAPGDLFYLDYQGVRYTYRVTGSQVIRPNQIDALDIGEDKPYATLITCDPPGTANNRLLVFGEQISPDPSGVTETQSADGPTADRVVGNQPTLLEKIFGR